MSRNNFSLDNTKNTGLNGYVYDFTAGYDAIAVDLLNIHNEKDWDSIK